MTNNPSLKQRRSQLQTFQSKQAKDLMNEFLLRYKVIFFSYWPHWRIIILACWFLHCSLYFLSTKRGFVEPYSKVLVWAIIQWFFFSPKMCLWDSSQHAKTRRGFATGGVGKEVSGSLYSTPHFQLFITVVLSASMNHLFFCIGDFLFSHWVVKLRWPFALKFFRLSPQSK